MLLAHKGTDRMTVILTTAGRKIITKPLYQFYLSVIFNLEIAGKIENMPIVDDLKAGTYYLVQLEAESPIQLIAVVLNTREAVLLRSYMPVNEDFFRLKKEKIHKIVEELDEETANIFERILFEEEEEAGKEEELFEYEEDDEE